ncbi:PhzF family phenazine biosynthesis protein [Thalassomonas sp. M1454]|uniref:PhzF family phenazine biosynthesis protein n=1 Tax=Thalassomonas sp. M1454 TaxID=2594477 RepID=UPI00117C0A23|nr:PhzF family phenazine biosynthesis protein [Thalassomonas sp. M1454]TRX58095.1 PhzF family phenazine biosynthesis protein [Thalassomonas sp. M1454]
MILNINIVDAFTSVAFKGNSAAVLITEHNLSDELMQNIAIENNLSETAFVKPLAKNSFQIRWFSPITEIDFCGHATLAAAFTLFAQDKSLLQVVFQTLHVGELTVKRKNDGLIEMSFPNCAPKHVDHIPEDLLNGLSIKPKQVLKNQQAYFAVYEHESDVIQVVQNSNELKKLKPYDVVVTAPASKYDFISRYFWPANGGDEDPVTGSIHAGLAPFWAKQLNKDNLSAYQASQRGGELTCRISDDRVLVSGKAVQYLQGTITV